VEKPRFLAGAFGSLLLILPNWAELLCHVDVVDQAWVRRIGGVTRFLGFRSVEMQAVMESKAWYV
jgi:hypothetical protein